MFRVNFRFFLFVLSFVLSVFAFEFFASFIVQEFRPTNTSVFVNKGHQSNSRFKYADILNGQVTASKFQTGKYGEIFTSVNRCKGHIDSASVKKLFILGSSTTELVHNPTGSRLHDFLNRSKFFTENNLCAFNLAVGGSHQQQIAFRLIWLIPLLRPDFILISTNFTDRAMLQRGEWYSRAIALDKQIESEVTMLRGLKAMLERIVPNSKFLVSEMMRRLRVIGEDSVVDVRGEILPSRGRVSESFVQALGVNLAIVRSYGVQSIVMSEAVAELDSLGSDPKFRSTVSGRLSPMEFIDGQQLFNAKMEAVCASEGNDCRYIPLAENVADSSYFRDYIHLNVKGAERASQIIIKAMERP